MLRHNLMMQLKEHELRIYVIFLHVTPKVRQDE
jgi:hypothetical protein